MAYRRHNLYIALFVYYVVTTSDKRKKFKVEVSTDWYVAIEHWRLSSIKVIFVDYQTSKL